MSFELTATGPLPSTQSDWRAMCGDRVITDDGWTGRVVAQHGPYSWVSMEATNSPRTCATALLRPAVVDVQEDEP